MKTFERSWQVVWILTWSLACATPPLVAQQSERDLLAVLQSDAPKAEKALTCKRLAVFGSEAAVSELAKLLPDPELSSWARIGLEAIPGSASKAALRDAARKLEGRTLVGVLNSLGVLRDTEAISSLVPHCESPDREVAAAAIAALGEIGNSEATAALRSGLVGSADAGLRGEYAQAAVVCAERLVRESNWPAATELYQLVRNGEVPKQRKLEATRGLFLLSGGQGGPILSECLSSGDEDTFRLGLSLARIAPGEEAQQVLAQAIRHLEPERAGLILLAMADRLAALAAADQAADLSPLIEAAGSGAKPIRLAALSALGRLGNVSVIETLIAVAAEADPELAAAAKKALAEVPGEEVNQRLTQLLGTSSGARLRMLVQLVGSRRIPATGDLLRILDSRDAELRKAALLALGETVDLKELPLLVERAAAEADLEEVAAARQALRAAAVRMPQPDACAELLAGSVERVSEATQVFLIETLGEVGGRKALDAIIRCAKGDVNALQDAGSKVLGKWSNLADADALLDYARSGPTNQYRLRAWKGYVALARRFAMPESDRVGMCRSALGLAAQPGERKLVLEVLKLHPGPDAFLLATELAEAGDLKAEASEVATAIAQKLGGQGIDLERLKGVLGSKSVELEILEARYGAGDNWQDVTGSLRKFAGKLPWVSLPSPNFNQSFGGDPAPGVPKQLRIRYRLDGVEGEVSLPENALVLLPVPKE